MKFYKSELWGLEKKTKLRENEKNKAEREQEWTSELKTWMFH